MVRHRDRRGGPADVAQRRERDDPQQADGGARRALGERGRAGGAGRREQAPQQVRRGDARQHREVAVIRAHIGQRRRPRARGRAPRARHAEQRRREARDERGAAAAEGGRHRVERGEREWKELLVQPHEALWDRRARAAGAVAAAFAAAAVAVAVAVPIPAAASLAPAIVAAAAAAAPPPPLHLLRRRAEPRAPRGDDVGEALGQRRRAREQQPRHARRPVPERPDVHVHRAAARRGAQRRAQLGARERGRQHERAVGGHAAAAAAAAASREPGARRRRDARGAARDCVAQGVAKAVERQQPPVQAQLRRARVGQRVRERERVAVLAARRAAALGARRRQRRGAAHRAGDAERDRQEVVGAVGRGPGGAHLWPDRFLQDQQRDVRGGGKGGVVIVRERRDDRRDERRAARERGDARDRVGRERVGRVQRKHERGRRGRVGCQQGLSRRRRPRRRV